MDSDTVCSANTGFNDGTEEPASKRMKIDTVDTVSDPVSYDNNILENTNVSERDSGDDCKQLNDANDVLLENPNSLSLVSHSQHCVPGEPLGEKPQALSETQAGITQYMSNHKGFSAIIKQRYSDFIVNEIDVEDHIVHLTDLCAPKDVETDKDKTEEEAEQTTGVISSEDLEKLNAFIQEKDKNATFDIEVSNDKTVRAKIHKELKQRFPLLETTTKDVNGKKIIQVIWRKGRTRNSQMDEWPTSKKSCRYVKFVLYKENKDTLDAINLIAKNLKVKEGMFQYAGTKDRRAKTSQEVTAHRIHPRKLASLNKVLWNMGLGNFRYAKEPLKLGKLSGNHFTIVLRNIQESSDKVDAAISSLKQHGFINYFGLQRFGTTSVATHDIGRALLHCDWEKAIDLILKPREDQPSKDSFRRVWAETHDAIATLNVTPRFCGLERNLLEALKKNMKPLNALEKISRNTRLLYVHSYQALIWNLMASRRLSEFGQKVVIGDLVLTKEMESRENPTVVSEANFDQFSLKDVVLPLPGHDVVYPSNGVYQWYKERLEADGLDVDNMKRTQKDYSLPGAYRHIAVLPSNVSWKHCQYDDYTIPLTQSDLDRVKGEESPLKNDEHNGKLKAVVLEMSLPPSSYATMALRELLRVETSVAYQASLNNLTV